MKKDFNQGYKESSSAPTLTNQTLRDFLTSMSRLRDAGILINKKDFTCQVGEWLVESIFGGKRAVSAIQKGWDVDANGKHIQVKSHAKAEHNKARWSAVNFNTLESVDELVIVVFTFDYKLREFFCVPWQDAKLLAAERGRIKPRWEINWNRLSSFKWHIEDLPRQDIVQMFR